MLGRAVTLNARFPFGAPEGLGLPEPTCDRLTAFGLSYVDDPVICHQSVATPEALELLSAAGVERKGLDLVYGNDTEYLDHIRDAPDGTVCFQHAFPEGQFERAYAIERALLITLNDKGLLPRWVQADRLPSRRVLTLDELRGAADLAFPVVLKYSTSRSLGNGMGVRFLHSAEDLRRTPLPPTAAGFVVEEYLDVVDNWCATMMLTTTGVRVMGAARQMTNELGQNTGNLYGEDVPADVLSVAEAVALAAYSAGYRGVAGMDIVGTRDGRTLVIDLNFRFNASTVLAVVADRVPGLKRYLRRDLARISDLKPDCHAALVAMAERAYLWPIGLVANEDATWTFAFASIGDSVDELDAVVRRVADATR